MPYELIAVGMSWGGVRALERILPSLPPDLPSALVVVQHRRADSPADMLSSLLRSSSSLPVKDIEDKDPIESGRVYIAPPDYHLIVEPGQFSLSTEASVDFSRPSVDVLFETAADAYGPSLIAVVLTGLLADGARGLKAVKARGGFVIVQHPGSAERPSMPRAAIETGLADQVVPLDEIGTALVDLVRPPAKEASA